MRLFQWPEYMGLRCGGREGGGCGTRTETGCRLPEFRVQPRKSPEPRQGWSGCVALPPNFLPAGPPIWITRDAASCIHLPHTRTPDTIRAARGSKRTCWEWRQLPCPQAPSRQAAPHSAACTGRGVTREHTLAEAVALLTGLRRYGVVECLDYARRICWHGSSPDSASTCGLLQMRLSVRRAYGSPRLRTRGGMIR